MKKIFIIAIIAILAIAAAVFVNITSITPIPIPPRTDLEAQTSTAISTPTNPTKNAEDLQKEGEISVKQEISSTVETSTSKLEVSPEIKINSAREIEVDLKGGEKIIYTITIDIGGNIPPDDISLGDELDENSMLLSRENITEVIAMPKGIEFPQKFILAKGEALKNADIISVSYTDNMGKELIIKG